MNNTNSGKPATQPRESSVPTSEKLPDGQYADHWIMSDEERAKGFVRPVRRTYKHLKCGGQTTMPQKIAETYAANPGFYGSTYCVKCGNYFPVGENGEFVWLDEGAKVGT